MNKLTLEELASIEYWEEFCNLHEMEFDEEDPDQWSGFWRVLGLEEEYDNDELEHYTVELFYECYLRWYDIVTSPLYKAMSEN